MKRERESSREVGSNREGLIPLDCVPCPATSVLRPLHPHVSSPRLPTTFPFCYSKRRTNPCTRVCIYIYTLSTGLYTCVRACIQEKSEMGKRKERERGSPPFVRRYLRAFPQWPYRILNLSASHTHVHTYDRSHPHSRRSQKLAVSKSPLPDSPGCIGIGGDVRAPLPEGGEGGGGGDETAS